jgi:hypothetical protein
MPDTQPIYKGCWVEAPPEIYGWQLKVKELMDEMVERKVYWFWEPTGGVGKTDFQRWLYHKHKTEMYVLGGKAGDMKAAIAAHVEKCGVGPEWVVINQPRSSKDYFSFQGVEEISDGIFFSGKYESGMVCTRKPKIMVFANAPPIRHREGEATMSLDRWEIYEIKDGTIERY